MTFKVISLGFLGEHLLSRLFLMLDLSFVMENSIFVQFKSLVLSVKLNYPYWPSKLVWGNLKNKLMCQYFMIPAVELCFHSM